MYRNTGFTYSNISQYAFRRIVLPLVNIEKLEWGKKHTFWHWEWGRISAPYSVDREHRNGKKNRNHPKPPQTLPKPHQTSLSGYTSTYFTTPYPHTLSGPRQPQPLYFPCSLPTTNSFINVLSNNLQTFKIINYIFVLPLRRHDSIISRIQIHAPRLYQTLCVFSKIKYKKYLMLFSFCLLGHVPGLLGIKSLLFRTWSTGITN